ncbi:MAG: GNAT family N-acetyltransferase [Spirochaetaceae bacterium]|jgi:GNAT superfamily N-acetyltransferase|nr:GNAT family N-acetyltransferase [Spirochaetaceae bacterium]
MIHSFETEYRWRKTGTTNAAALFLRSREAYCVAAAARFLQASDASPMSDAGDQVWTLQDPKGRIIALLIYSKRTLFPILNGKSDIRIPRSIERFFKKAEIHAIQGIRREAETLETYLRPLGIAAAEKIDYDLMSLDRSPNPSSLSKGPRKLVLRTPAPADTDTLFRLQSAYEQEEVLPPGTEFYPAACRLSLEHIIAHERILIAELEGRIIGKINTSAASFSRRQIGGVYILPEYRGLGIASRLTATFVRDIIAEGKGVTLFVKKLNLSARSVYRRIGFITLEDYRISYY